MFFAIYFSLDEPQECQEEECDDGWVIIQEENQSDEKINIPNP